jgi:hypothetical protein
MQPLSPPRSMHKAPGRGAAVSLHLITAPFVHSGPCPSPPPQQPSHSNSTHLQSGHNRNGCPHFLPPLSFPGLCPHILFTTQFIFACPTLALSPPLINPPLIPLPHIMGTPLCSNRQVTGTHPDINKPHSQNSSITRGVGDRTGL